MTSWKQKKRFLDRLTGEKGWSRKIWGDRLTVCLVYPNRYRTGMSNLGFHAVYALINRHPDCLCERAFLPESDDGNSASDGASLTSIESQRPLTDFDVIAFSLSFENDYPHVLQMLEAAGIPMKSSDRTERHPLVIGGGIAVTLNPEPLAGFFDLFLIGEGEAVLPGFLDRMASLPRDTARDAVLGRIQREIAGAYVPRFYRVNTGSDGRITAREALHPDFPERISRPWIADLDAFATEQQIVTRKTELGEMYLTEISRGCGHGCRFCAAGFAYRPPRFRSAAALESSFRHGLETGKTIGLLGTAVSDHPALPSLCRTILDRRGNVAVGSLRMERLDTEMAAILRETGVETVSLAPEAGSQRLRNVIRKGIGEEEIFSAVEKLMECGIVQARLYFMIGLPTETDEDVEAIVRLVREMQHRARKFPGRRNGFRRLTLSINQFIPKAATPFQWHPLENVAVVRQRIRRIREGLRGERAVRIIHELPKWNYIQALLALGDRQVGEILLTAHRLGGNWIRAFREADIRADSYVYRKKEPDEILPWDFIDHGVPKTFLIHEYRKALSGET